MDSGATQRDASGRGAEERVLLLTALPTDTRHIGALLTETGIDWCACRDLDSFSVELARSAGAAVLTSEVLDQPDVQCLVEAVARQPEWSEIPLIVLTHVGRRLGARTQEVLDQLGNVSLLERPLGMPTLLSAVQAALRARRHQYRIRDYVEEQARLVEEIRKADQAKDNFLATLAHELRNPLAPILTTSYLLRDRVANDPDLERLRGMIERQARNMSRLVEDLLDVSRITRGKVRLRKERVDLAEVAAHAVEAALPFVKERGHQLHISLPSDPLAVDADSVRLEQVVLNLLVNAVKYTEPGGSIQLALRREDGSAVLSVKDTGEGIPPELLSHVFQLFTQAERTLDRSQGGLGLGLTTARHLVEMHGGTLQAFSEGTGCGSEFILRLPLAAPAEAGERAPVPRPDGMAGRRAPRGTRVLVVDDNRDAAESVAELVECWGYEVNVAHSGEAGLSAAAAQQPGVILLDIGMPGMDGYAVARRLRAAPETRDAVLVALTGYSQEEYRQLSREVGFDHHLVKPLDPVELKALLFTG